MAQRLLATPEIDDTPYRTVTFELDAFMRETEKRLLDLVKRQEGYVAQLRIPRTVGILEEALSRITNEIEGLEELLAHYKVKRELNELKRHLVWIESEISLIEADQVPEGTLVALQARRSRLASQASKLEKRLGSQP
jgi:hypothetical protein